jgi:hypothetical protein
MRLHSWKDQRFLCPECHKTCSVTPGTAVYRRRPAAETVPLVVTVLAHGCPPHAMVAACGFDERTVTRWRARGGVPGQAVQAPRVEPPRDRGQGPADAIRVQTQGGMVWRALAMMVKTRVWLAGEVSEPRAMTRMRRLSERVRACAPPRPLWGCPDGWWSSLRAMRATWRDPVGPGGQGRPRWRPWRHGCLAPVVKRSAQRRVVEGERRLGEGTPARVETLRRRSQGDGVLNPASLERLNATCRERLASRTRRGRARRTLTLPHGRSLIGTLDNFWTPHASLRLASPGVGRRCVPRTPAMAPGITEHGWSVRARLASHVPPPRWTPPKQRGRPSRALKRLMERCCCGNRSGCDNRNHATACVF